MWKWIVNLFRRKPTPPAPTPTPPAPEPVPVPGPVPPAPEPTPDPDLYDYDPDASELLGCVNEARTSAGLPPMCLDSRLVAASTRHALVMARAGRLAHEALGDGTPGMRATQAGYVWLSISENIGWNYPDAASVVKGWLDSPGHRANILGRAADFGGDVARGAGGECYWCALFGIPK